MKFTVWQPEKLGAKLTSAVELADITEDINLLEGVNFGETLDSTFSTSSKNVDVSAKQGLHSSKSSKFSREDR